MLKLRTIIGLLLITISVIPIGAKAQHNNIDIEQITTEYNNLEKELENNWSAIDQNNIDIAFRCLEIGKMLNDQTKIADSYNNIGKAFFFSGKRQQALLYYQQGLYTSKSSDYKEGIAISNYNLGLIFANWNNHARALQYYEKSLKIDKKISNEKGIAQCYNVMGISHQHLGNHKQAIIYYNQSLDIFKELNDYEGVANTQINIGNIKRINGDYKTSLKCYMDALNLMKSSNNLQGETEALYALGELSEIQGNYDEALDHYLKCLNISRAINNQKSVSLSLNNIGNIYKIQREYNKALDLYKESLAIKEKIDDRIGITISLDNIGNIYDMIGDYKNALQHYNRSLEISDALGMKDRMATSFENIGIIYNKQSEFTKALSNYMKAMQIRIEIQDKSGIANTAYNLGVLYLKQNDFYNARMFFTQSLDIAKELANNKLIMISYGGLADAYIISNEYKKALEYYKKHTDLKEHIYTNEYNQNIATLQTKYETEKKDQAIELLSKDTIIQKNTIAKQRVIVGIISLIMLLLIIISWYTYKIFKTKQKAYKTLKDKNDLIVIQKRKIEKQTSELYHVNQQLVNLDKFKQDMIGMIVHDLKNPLNTIINFSEEEPDEYKMESINQSGKMMLNLVSNILDVFKYEKTKMAISIGNYSLNDMVNNAYKETSQLINQKGIQFISNLDNDYIMNVDQDVITRVIVNIVTNAIKYTPNGGLIQIDAIEETNDLLKIIISDNGVGIEIAHQEKIFEKYKQVSEIKSGTIKSTGLGLAFCKMAINAHNCDIGVMSEPEKGASFWFTLPFIAQKEIKAEPQPEIYSNLDFQLNYKNNETLSNNIGLLKELDVYSITHVKKIIKELENMDIINIDKWILNMNRALLTCNENEYTQLIKILEDGKQ